MSMRAGAGIVVATLLLSSIAHATENNADGSGFGGIRRNDRAVELSRRDDTMPPPRQAPVGHRQPRIGDVPAVTQLSPLDLELKREDERIDRKIIICRGC